MKLTKQIFSFALLAILATACNNTDYKKTPEGFPYKIFSDGKGTKIEKGNVVSFHMTQKLKDSVLETTYGGMPQYMPIPKDNVTHPLAKILLGAREGDSVKILQPIDSILKSNPQAAMNPLLTSNKGKNLETIVKVVKVFKTEDEAHEAFDKESVTTFYKQPQIAAQNKKDKATIDSFLRANNIQAQPTAMGTYIQIINPGSGPKPKRGQFVSVRYTGKDLTGKVFDTNTTPGKPVYTIQVGAGGSIPGFEDAIRELPKGAKANVYIPSVIGYGAQGNPPAIQPNQNLVFEISVEDISDTRPEQPMPKQADTTKRR